MKVNVAVTAAWAAALGGWLMLTGPAAGRTIYVQPGGEGNGTSWQRAYGEVATALQAARRGDQLWVAAGTYRPTTGTDRNATFQLVSGVSLYGGFAGGETALEQRDWRAHETILSGDIGQRGLADDNAYHVVTGADDALLDGFTIRDGHGSRPGQGGQPGAGQSGQGQRGNRGQGAQGGPGGPPPPDQVLRMFDRDGDQRISRQEAPPPMQRDFDRLDANRDGYITADEMSQRGGQGGPQGRPGAGQGGPNGPGAPGGQGRQGSGPTTHTSPDAVMSGPNPMSGAGLLNYQCAPTVRHCTFRDNVAFKGGAVYNMVSTSFPPRPNSTTRRAVFQGCDFLNNTAYGRGGGVANDLGTHPVFVDCRFIANRCDAKGGGMYNDFGCSPTLRNCLFAQNEAAAAAALGNDGGSCPSLDQVTFAANHATAEGASLYQGSGPPNTPTVTRSIFWANTCDAGPDGIYNWHDCLAQVSDSILQEAYPGAGNHQVDPQLDADWVPAAASPAAALGWSPTRHGTLDNLPEPAGMQRLTGVLPRPTKPSASGLPQTKVVHVKPGGTGHGASWLQARGDLQQAIDHAWAVGAEVWVAAGTYLPTGDGRHASFMLRDSVAVYGGFAGTETDRGMREPDAHPTVLSGDLGRRGDASDNAYHVLQGANQARLDSVTITGGHADGWGFDGQGGGLVNYVAGTHSRIHEAGGAGLSPTLVNCRFTGNQAKEGGAVYNYDRAAPIFEGCTFEGNRADFGGAIVDRVGVVSTITRCVFKGNAATWSGGALFFDYGPRPQVSDTQFHSNQAGAHGGAVYAVSRASQLEATDGRFENCVFGGNRAGMNGGAVGNDDQSRLLFTRCTLQDNHAGGTGGAVWDDRQAASTLTECRFAGNAAVQGAADHQPSPGIRMPGA